VHRVKLKIKHSLYRPGQDVRITAGWGSQISRHSAQYSGKVVSPKHRSFLTPSPRKKFLVLIFVRCWVDLRDMVRKEGLCQIPVTPSGIEPATFWLVEQCLNQLHHRVFRDTYSNNSHPSADWFQLTYAFKSMQYQLEFTGVSSPNQTHQSQHI
jgi:hypothetical protein